MEPEVSFPHSQEPAHLSLSWATFSPWPSNPDMFINLYGYVNSKTVPPFAKVYYGDFKKLRGLKL